MARPGSDAPFVVALEFVSGGRTTRLEASNVFQALDYESVAMGAWKGTVTLYDKGGEVLEDLLIGSGVDRQLRTRFHWEREGLSASPVFFGAILVPNYSFLPDGIVIALEVTAKPVADVIIDKKPRAFAAGMRISDMVLEIANDRGWPTIDRRGNPTIETTRDPMIEPFSTSGESDVKFIADQLRKQAVNADGNSGYRFYFDPQGAVHFHTPGFIRPRVRNYTFARDGNGEVIMFSPSETSYLAHIGGGGNAQFESSSSLDGSQVDQESTTARGVDGTVDRVDRTSLAVPDAGTGLASKQSVTARDADEVRRVAADRRARMSEMHITAEMDVVGTHDVEVMDYVNVSYRKANGDLHYLSGNYLVQKVRHRLDNTGWRTSFSLSKHGVQPRPGTVTRTAAQTVQPQ